MGLFLAPFFGTGKDGILNVTSNTTWSSLVAKTGCSGTVESRTLTVVSTTGFSAGQKIFIHKSRGNTTTNPGSAEVNQIASVGSGELILVIPLQHSYQNSGNDQSQVIVMPEYKHVNIASTFSLTADAWDGDTGGILAFYCNGLTLVSGTISASEKGFRGGAGTNGGTANSGEGELAEGSPSHSINNSGGAGGQDGVGGGDGGTGWLTDNTFVTRFGFGGGGGGCAGSGSTGGTGFNGGGLIYIISKFLVVTGSIQANGGGGGTRGHGRGGGGSIFVRTRSAELGTTLLSAVPGALSTWNADDDMGGGGGGAVDGQNGFTSGGGFGLVRVETPFLTGTTSPAVVQGTTGIPFVGNVGLIG